MENKEKEYVLPVVTREENLAQHRGKKFKFIRIVVIVAGVLAFGLALWVYQNHFA